MTEPSHARATVRTGADVAADHGWGALQGCRVCVISNHTGVLYDGRHIVDSMVAAGVDVTAILGPEHGFRGTAQADASEGDCRDPRTGVAVYDAYRAGPDRFGELLDASGSDTVVFDIQDVGVRFYTYIWTMYNALVAAARLQLRFMVLDRPNPIGGQPAGPRLEPGYESEVGLKPIAQVHGMTVGELAGYADTEYVPTDAGRRAGVEVVTCAGWHGRLRAQHLDLPWVPPSPNMPTADTATVYPGTCYFVGTNLCEGRGTTRPFELVGAPYLDHRWGDSLNDRDLPGVLFREAVFVPTFGRHQGVTCVGVQLHITDVDAFDPLAAGVAMLVEAHRYAGFAWSPPAQGQPGSYWIDGLSGSSRLRHLIDRGADVADVVASWHEGVAEFDRGRRAHLLYPRP